ncbi:MAG: MAPEG family protein [Sphingobium sp.]
MALLPITSVTAAISVVMLVGLGTITGLQRKKTSTSLGLGTDETLLRRIRAHGNFAEYVPIALIVLGLVETGGASVELLWTIAGLLIIGRLFHAYALLTGTLPLRGLGMLMTFTSMLIGAVMLLWP